MGEGCGWGLAQLPCLPWWVFVEGRGQLLSSWGWQQIEVGKGVSFMVSILLSSSLVGGKVKKGPFLPAHAARSLLQKSCFRKTFAYQHH